MKRKTVLSLSYGRIVVKPEADLHGLVPESFETYQLIDPDDIVVRPTDLQNDKRSLRVGFARDSGIITSAYLCLQTQGALRPAYGYRLLNSYDLRKVFYGLGSGLRQNLAWSDFKYLACCVPPPSEQDSIVRFLSHADSQIGAYIASRRNLIRLLNEQKRVVAYRAVTGGLDPNVEIKASGVASLGDVPKHWAISRMKNEFDSLDSRRAPLSSSERGLMTERRYDYYGASGVIDRVDDYLFDDELILVAEDGANLVLRNLPLAIIARGKFWVNNHAHILKPKRGDLRFLASLVESRDYRPWISGAAQPKLTKDRLLSVNIAVPPPDEQDEIMRWLDTETAPLDTALARAQREITLLLEYRTRLMSDVTAGKLDVRDTVAKLPSELAVDSIAGEVLADPDSELGETDVEEAVEAVEA